ncbi:hypothetical protein OC834_007298 [Tilletia horrida]|nr:hypothetical protein OC834_007298 [Tilletia horrida]
MVVNAAFLLAITLCLVALTAIVIALHLVVLAVHAIALYFLALAAIAIDTGNTEQPHLSDIESSTQQMRNEDISALLHKNVKPTAFVRASIDPSISISVSTQTSTDTNCINTNSTEENSPSLPLKPALKTTKLTPRKQESCSPAMRRSAPKAAIPVQSL